MKTQIAPSPSRGLFAAWRRTPLWQKIFGGLVAGVLLGLLAPDQVSYVAWVGELFIRLIRMLVAPLILVMVASGVIALADPRRLGSVGLGALGYFAAQLALGVALGLTLGTIVGPGLGVALGEAAPATLTPAKSTKDVLLGIVPTNVFEALASGSTLSIIFFAAFLGAAVLVAGEAARPVGELMKSAAAVLLRMVTIVMEVAPFGVAALVAVVIGAHGLAAFGSLGKLALCVLCGCLIQTFVFHPLILRFVAWRPVLPFYRSTADLMLVAFSTASSSASLPVALRVAREKLELPDSMSATVLPLGATIGMDGTGLYMALVTLFAAQAFGVAVSPEQMLLLLGATTLMAMGAAPVPSGSLFVLPALTSLIGLSAEQTALVVGLILPFDRPLDMVRTVPNVMTDIVATATLQRWMGKPQAPSPTPPACP